MFASDLCSVLELVCQPHAGSVGRPGRPPADEPPAPAVPPASAPWRCRPDAGLRRRRRRSAWRRDTRLAPVSTASNVGLPLGLLPTASRSRSRPCRILSNGSPMPPPAPGQRGQAGSDPASRAGPACRCRCRTADAPAPRPAAGRHAGQHYLRLMRGAVDRRVAMTLPLVLLATRCSAGSVMLPPLKLIRPSVKSSDRPARLIEPRRSSRPPRCAEPPRCRRVSSRRRTPRRGRVHGYRSAAHRARCSVRPPMDRTEAAASPPGGSPAVRRLLTASVPGREYRHAARAPSRQRRPAPAPRRAA